VRKTGGRAHRERSLIFFKSGIILKNAKSFKNLDEDDRRREAETIEK
jgi:hypothetical protein